VRVQVGDIRLFFETYGAEWVLDGDRMRRRPVMLALHGGPGVDATGLRCALAPLADTAQLVVPDQRGHGRSDRGAPATWNLARWAADVRELCEVTGLQAPVVLGRSFGGFVAQQYAGAYPQHPAGLILMATSARSPAKRRSWPDSAKSAGTMPPRSCARTWKRPANNPPPTGHASAARCCHGARTLTRGGPALRQHGSGPPRYTSTSSAVRPTRWTCARRWATCAAPRESSWANTTRSSQQASLRRSSPRSPMTSAASK
jgi:pimeloyl-ACP methyl ester carboxylesterase